MKFSQFTLYLPDWVEEFFSDSDRVYSTIEERMALVIELSELNIRYGTGGPFGAGIFDLQTNKLLAPGVNMVVSSHCSIAHAEIVAIMIAQQMAEHFDLGSKGFPSYELTSSTEPCAMCFGAVPWSGIKQLVCGANYEDVSVLGFDEGSKPSNWAQSLENRGIKVFRDVLREEAFSVLQQYKDSGGIIYNGRQAFPPVGT